MFAFDRDTATLVAVAVCIAATVYLFKELKKTKEEFTTAKEEFTTAMAEKHQQSVVYTEVPHLAPVPVVSTPEPTPPKVPVTRRKSVIIAEKESPE
jgi:hypothetical protein|tara:strand:- start:11669 stop:11956 length:288 start_codon:yes stop_codon:yes gene_type:complete